MRIDIMTLFPDIVGDMLCESILGRAQERGIIRIECHQIREFTTNKQMQVDDHPYGGGMGMIMQAQPLYDCWKNICEKSGGRVHTVLMTPQGNVFNQAEAKRLSKLSQMILVCGHYEGVDERFIEKCVDEEISIGDYVLTGGEIAAMAVADAVCRLVPGVLKSEECYTEESHWNGLLEHPHYTRPEVWEGKSVPAVLLSGHHANIAKWRRKESLRRTYERRPELLERAELVYEDSMMLLDIKKDL